jgi:hypothetical protein
MNAGTSAQFAAMQTEDHIVRTDIGSVGLPFLYDDGGRHAAGFRGRAGDCVCRAIAIATGLPYQKVYDDLNSLSRSERITSRHPMRSHSRTGVRKRTLRKYLLGLGWQWVPTMSIGRGCTVHLRPQELPDGRLIVSVSRHLVAVIDGVVRDTHDCSRYGTRCVYGYFIRPE